ncbi:MAG: transporter [Nitrospirota bacterium]
MKFKGLGFHHLLFALSSLLSAFCFVVNSYAAHPLITDDTGTQGKDKFEFELGGEYGHEDEDGVTENSMEIVPVFAYGITDDIDIELCVPYLYVRTKETEITTEAGFSDVEIDLKWRFYEKDGLSFALRPLISLPTGDEDRGLGAGKVGYSLLLFVTKEVKPWNVDNSINVPWSFDLNIGYKRNENKNDEREDIWHASLSSRVEVAKDLNVVADIGIETNPDKFSDMHPAFILGGFIYSISENLDVDFGVKGGLNKPETDYSILAGITFRR